MSINDQITAATGKKFREGQRRAATEKLEQAKRLLIDACLHADAAEDDVLEGHIDMTLASLEDGLDLILEGAGR